jgi:hypothetical protein
MHTTAVLRSSQLVAYRPQQALTNAVSRAASGASSTLQHHSRQPVMEIDKSHPVPVKEDARTACSSPVK